MEAVQGGPIRPAYAPRDRKGQRIRRFVFTLNNWTEEEYTYLTTVFAPQTTWFVVGRETAPETGTSHLQGACILGTQWSFSKLKTLIGLKRAHIEPMRGKPEDSLVYCTKEDSEAFVCGTLPSPGKRSDIALAVEEILQGSSVRQLAQDPQIGAVAVVKYHKGLTVLRSLTQPVRTTAPFVFWLYGETGVGKTRCAFKSARCLARNDGRGEDDIWISSGGLKWFDGYDGQSVAIFDDFRAKHVSSFPFLLRLLDRYPVQCEFKGGFVSWVPKYIFITCPYTVDECFRTRGEHVPEDMRQLHRRINKEICLTGDYSKAARKQFCQSILAVVRGGDGGDSEGDVVLG